jgi:hypothetical protein
MKSKTLWVLAGIALVVLVISLRDRQTPPAPESSTVRTEPATETKQAPVAVDYKIVIDEAMGGTKGTLVIRLPGEIETDALKRLAIMLRRDGRRHFERLFITYYLPGMRVGAGAWATTHFNPDLKVRILGREGGRDER